MKTDDLIRALATDGTPPLSLGAGLRRALLAGGAVSALLGLLLLGLRPGMPGLMLEPRILFKFAATLPLAGIATLLVLRLSQPGARVPPVAALLFLPLLILCTGAATEMLNTPESLWMARLVGRNARYCLLFVPLISAPLLVAALFALRRGAPTRPARAGAGAGLAAGALGGALYALHCPDDSPFFVIVWYGLAISAVCVVGGVLGRRFLAW